MRALARADQLGISPPAARFPARTTPLAPGARHVPARRRSPRLSSSGIPGRLQRWEDCAEVGRRAGDHVGILRAATDPAGASSSSDDDDATPAPSSVTAAVAALFPSTHLPSQPSLPLLLYFPIGCAVAAFRMVLWMALLATDSRLTNQDGPIAALRSLLGVSVAWEGEEHLPAERHVLVSNHLTAGDLIVLYTRPQRYIHLITPAVPEAATRVANHRVLLRHATPATYDALATDEGIAESVHLFPEGGMTNGTGMMRFSRGFVRFSRDLPVVPMALRVRVPLGVSTHTLTSSFAANLFWFSFAPWISFTCTVLPPMRMEAGESPGRFAQRLEKAVAEELGVPVAELTIQAKKQAMQRAKLAGK
eukprot:jgi/Tetstr1/436103/TSEL_024951.t1